MKRSKSTAVASSNAASNESKKWPNISKVEEQEKQKKNVTYSRMILRPYFILIKTIYSLTYEKFIQMAKVYKPQMVLLIVFHQLLCRARERERDFWDRFASRYRTHTNSPIVMQN